VHLFCDPNLGKIGNPYPADPVEAAKVDSILDTLTEYPKSIEMTVQRQVKALLAVEPWFKEQVLEIPKRIT